MIHHILADLLVGITAQLGLVTRIAAVVSDAPRPQRNRLSATAKQFSKLLPGLFGRKVFEVVFERQGKNDIKTRVWIRKNRTRHHAIRPFRQRTQNAKRNRSRSRAPDALDLPSRLLRKQLLDFGVDGLLDQRLHRRRIVQLPMAGDPNADAVRN